MKFCVYLLNKIMVKNFLNAYQRLKLIIFLVLLLPLFWFGIAPGWNQVDSDFPNYYVSAQMLLKGNLYEAYDVDRFNNNIEDYNKKAKGLFVMYPPSTALTVIFLTPFDMLHAKRYWMILSLLAALGLVFLLANLFKIDVLDAANLILLCGFNLYNDLMLGQVYLVMVFLLFLAWHFYVQNKFVTAGILWGIVASIKFLPLFFLPFFIFKKNYKIPLVVILTCMIFHLITFILGGIGAYEAFIKVFMQNYFSGNVANQLATSVQYQSFEVLINLLYQKAYISIDLAILLKLFWKLIWLIICFWVCKMYFKSTTFIQVATSSITLLLLLLENGSASYHLLFALLAMLIVLQSQAGISWRMVVLGAFLLMGFLPFLFHLFRVEHLILSFIRLWCLCLFSGIFFIMLGRQNMINK